MLLWLHIWTKFCIRVNSRENVILKGNKIYEFKKRRKSGFCLYGYYIEFLCIIITFNHLTISDQNKYLVPFNKYIFK